MEQEKIIDAVTGVELTPSYQGNECLGSGDQAGYECCCDECDYYLYCFPEYGENQDIPEMLEKKSRGDH